MFGSRYFAAVVVAAGCLVHGVARVQEKNGGDDLPIIRQSDAPLRAIDARLFRALRAGDLTKVSVLLKMGADANAQDEQNTTALELATDCPVHPLQAIQMMLSHGANINYRGLSGGSTVLISTVISHPSNQTLLKFLLDHGAKVNTPNIEGATALSLAVRAGSVDTVALLIRRGANVNPPNLNPFSGSDFSDDGKDPGFVCCGNTPTFESLLHWNPKIFELLSSASTVNLDTPDPDGFNLIHYAVWTDNPDAIKLLASKGVNVNAVSKRGFTPLQFAITESNIVPDPLVVDALLKSGADPSIKNRAGKTAEDLLRDFVKASKSVGLGNQILKQLNPTATAFTARP